MAQVPASVAEFLRGKRIAVAGVSRTGASAANAVLRKLRAGGYDALAVNPNASQIDGSTCFPDLLSLPGDVDGVIVATHPDAAGGVVRHAIERRIRHVWFHRSFGQGSVSSQAVDECARADIACIVGGCPLMYCPPVDFGHRCMRAWLAWRGRVPR